MIDAVSPAIGLVPLASRPVKNVCSRTLVGPHSASYQLWYAVGLGFAGGGPLSRDDGLEASSLVASRRPLEHSLDTEPVDTEPDAPTKDGGDGLDCAEVGEDSNLVFECTKDVRTVA
jgi:hypothetical protein